MRFNLSIKNFIGENQMVLWFVTPLGQKVHKPPYTKAEEADFYRRIGHGPLTVARQKGYGQSHQGQQPPEQAAQPHSSDPLQGDQPNQAHRQ